MASQKFTHTKMSVAEMRMFRWMCRYARRNRIINDNIQGKVAVVSLVDKIPKVRMRWFGHVNRSRDAQ